MSEPLYATTINFGTLADINAGGNSITLGDKTFKNFVLATSSSATGSGSVSVPVASDINVTGVITGSVYELIFSGFNLSASTSGIGRAQVDMTINYDITVNDPDFVIYAASLTITGSLSGLGHTLLDETLIQAPPTYDTYALQATAANPFDTTQMTYTSTLDIHKDANVLAVGTAGNPNSVATITEIKQMYFQIDRHNPPPPVPEPAGLALWSLGCVTAGIFGWRARASRQMTN
ncbi:MAG: hypothetical protein JSS02_17750, partial [Planctomycetes bacterium]|nr:hypothetical protein [Planctomycetota bacterium]